MRAARWCSALLPLALLASCSDAAGPDGARALERVKHQVQAGSRVSGTPGNAAVRDWIAAELTRLGGSVQRQSFADTVAGKVWQLTNVIGHFGPSGRRRIALLAHFDTRPWCDEDPDSAQRHQYCPGANDAGSGVAVLLEVAEQMHLKPPVAGFLFDMVGDRDLEIWDEANSSQRATNLVDLVHEGAAATGARHFKSGVRYTLIDDHIPLLDAGMPAVDIIDFDYSAWHTSRDLPDQVSAESLAEVSRVACWIVYKSALSRP